VALIRASEPAGMPQHVWMCLEAEIGSNPGTLDHPSETGSAEWCASLRIELNRPQFPR
jgi:hypothetical protein